MEAQTPVWVTWRAGTLAVAAVSGWTALQMFRAHLRARYGTDEVERPFDDTEIPFDALAVLCLHGSLQLQRSAAEMLLSRATEPVELRAIIQCCSRTSLHDATKAVTALNLLSKSPQNGSTMLAHGAIPALVACIVRRDPVPMSPNDGAPTPSDDDTPDWCLVSRHSPELWQLHRRALVTLHDLIASDDGGPKEGAFTDSTELHSLVAALAGLIKDADVAEVQYWTLRVLRACGVDPSPTPPTSVLLTADVVGALAEWAKAHTATTALQTGAFEALVTICGDGSDEVTAAVLGPAVDEGLLLAVAAALHSPDPDLVFWSLGLLHELIVREIAPESIAATAPRLHTGLVASLAASEAAMQRNILRVIALLQARDPAFASHAASARCLEQLLVGTGSGDDEVAARGCAILHNVVMSHPTAASTLAATPRALDRLAVLAKRQPKLARRVAEILGHVCSDRGARMRVCVPDALHAAATLLAVDASEEVQVAATTAVLGLLGAGVAAPTNVSRAGLVPSLAALVSTGPRRVPELAVSALAWLICHGGNPAASANSGQHAADAHRKAMRESAFVVVDWLSRGDMPDGAALSAPSLHQQRHGAATLVGTSAQARVIEALRASIAAFSQRAPWTPAHHPTASGQLPSVAVLSTRCVQACNLTHTLTQDASCVRVLIAHGILPDLIALLAKCLTELASVRGVVDEVLRRHGHEREDRHDLSTASLPRDALDTSAILDILHASPGASRDASPFDHPDHPDHVDGGGSAETSPNRRRFTSTPRSSHRRDDTTASPSRRAAAGTPPSERLHSATALRGGHDGGGSGSGSGRRPAVAVMAAPRRPMRRASVELAEAQARELRQQQLSPLVPTIDEAPESDQSQTHASPGSDGTRDLAHIEPADAASPIPTLLGDQWLTDTDPRAVTSTPAQPSSEAAAVHSASPPNLDHRTPAAVSEGSRLQLLSVRSRSGLLEIDAPGHASPSPGLPLPNFFRPATRSDSPAAVGGALETSGGSGSGSAHPLSALRRMPPRTPSMAGMETAAAAARASLARSGSFTESPPSAVSERIARRLLGRSIDPASSGLFAPSLSDSSLDSSRDDASRGSNHPHPLAGSPLRHSPAAPAVRVDAWSPQRSESGNPDGSAEDCMAATELTVNTSRSLGGIDADEPRSPNTSTSTRHPMQFSDAFAAVLAGQWGALDLDHSVLSELDSSLSALDPADSSLTDADSHHHPDSDSQHLTDAAAARADLLTLPGLHRHSGGTPCSPVSEGGGLDTTRSLESRVESMRHVRDVAEVIVAMLASAARASAAAHHAGAVESDQTSATADMATSITTLEQAVPTVWAALHVCRSPQVTFWVTAFLSTCTQRDRAPGTGSHPNAVKVLSAELSTSGVQISPNGLVARNDGWSLETAVGTLALPTQDTPLYFEVKVATDGPIQIGWASTPATFSPHASAGVGDVYGTFSLDGVQGCLRDWSSAQQSVVLVECRWEVGDVVGCALDAARGVARWYVNGQYAEAELASLPRHAAWRPAVSLGRGQQVAFNFGTYGFAFDPPHATGPSHSFLFSELDAEEGDDVGDADGAVNSDAPTVLPEAGASVIDLPESMPSLTPFVYFEAWGFGAWGQMGFTSRSNDGAEVKVCAKIRAGTLHIGAHAEFDIRGATAAVVGCGLATLSLPLPTSYAADSDAPATQTTVAFFVVDGDVLPTAIEWPEEGGLVSAANARPWVAGRRPTVNYGGSRFVYREADASAVRAGMAQQLLQSNVSGLPDFQTVYPSPVNPKET